MSKVITLSDYISNRQSNSLPPNDDPIYWTDKLPGGFEMSGSHLATPLNIKAQSVSTLGNPTDVILSIKTNIGQMMWLNNVVYAQMASQRKIYAGVPWQLPTVCSTDCSFTVYITGMNASYSKPTGYYGILNFRICDGEIVYFQNKNLAKGMTNLKFDINFKPATVFQEWYQGQIYTIPSMDYPRAASPAYNPRPDIYIKYAEP